MTLEEAQKQVDSWIKEYGVRYFSELTNMAILTEEVGELARVMHASMATNPSRKEKKTISTMRWQMFFGYFSALRTRPE